MYGKNVEVKKVEIENSLGLSLYRLRYNNNNNTNVRGKFWKTYLYKNVESIVEDATGVVHLGVFVVVVHVSDGIAVQGRVIQISDGIDTFDNVHSNLDGKSQEKGKDIVCVCVFKGYNNLKKSKK